MCDLLESQAESQYVIKIPSKTKNSFMAATTYNIRSIFGAYTWEDTIDSKLQCIVPG